MQSLLGGIVAVSCFGVAYAAHSIFPVKPIEEADMLLSQTTLGTVNVFSRDSLEKQAKTPKELIQYYLDGTANLEDVLILVTGKPTVTDAYAALQQNPTTAENKFLIRAAETHYHLSPAPSAPTPSAPAPSAPAPSAPPASSKPTETAQATSQPTDEDPIAAHIAANN